MAGESDPNTGSQTTTSRWLAVAAGGTAALTAFAKGVFDIAQGIRSYLVVLAIQKERLDGEDADARQRQIDEGQAILPRLEAMQGDIEENLARVPQ